jgi:hypothetical protein
MEHNPYVMKHFNQNIAALTLIFILCSAFSSYAQYDSLNHLGSSPVYFSTGFEKRAKEIEKNVGGALSFYKDVLNFKPDVTILVLSPADWSKYSRSPVYGMPHYTNDKTLIVAAANNDFWNSFIPDLKTLPRSLSEQIQKAYRQPDGVITMERFFDLLAIHELGHAFHMQGGLKMQRKWMGELFCNVFLHTYIAERSPDLLPALTVFPRMFVSGGTDGFAFTTLQQFEDNYNTIAMKHPKNYGWYQCKLHVGAQKIYDAGGKEVVMKLWKALKSQEAISSDEKFSELLSKDVHGSVAEVLTNWK